MAQFVLACRARSGNVSGVKRSLLLWSLGFLVPLGLSSACALDDDTFVCKKGDDACERALLCGNHRLDPGEICDSAESYCSQDCSEDGGRCGDGIIQSDFGETCDSAEAGPGGASGQGGNPGAGGLTEQAARGPVEGCASTCRAEKGYVCDPGSNTCGQTGLDAEDLVVEHREEVCVWIVGLMGGANQGTYCQKGEDVLELVAPTVEVCAATLELRETCTVGEFEEWARRKTRCEFYLEQSPCD